MLSYVSNYGSPLGQIVFLELLLEKRKTRATKVTRALCWLWLNQMLRGLKEEDVFSVLVNLAIDCLDQRISITLTPVISRSAPETRKEDLGTYRHRAREGIRWPRRQKWGC